jgi:putative addiction module component (TIGR02574 family)
VRFECEQKKLKSEIGKLGLSDKLLLIEDVWDEIAKSNTALPLPEWQKKELDIRLASHENAEHDTQNWQDVHRELRHKYK